MKKHFLNNELWSMTVGAAFQRANIYKTTTTDNEKKPFKTALRKELEENILPQYIKGGVKEEQHIKNMNTLSKSSSAFGSILQNGKMNFGVSQKMLNLYLKYQWCTGEIAAPTHFPVDRIIQEELNKTARKYKVKAIKVEPWTQFEDKTKYLAIIRFTEKLNAIAIELKGLSLPEVELFLFERR
jgi:hypothetical protein